MHRIRRNGWEHRRRASVSFSEERFSIGGPVYIGIQVHSVVDYDFIWVSPDGIKGGYRINKSSTRPVLYISDDGIRTHHHVPAAVRYGDVTQLVAPAVRAYPQSHLLLGVDRQGTTVRLVPNADEGRQREAYEALALGSEPHGNLVRAAEKTLSEAPVTDRLGKPGVGKRWSVSD